ncbi:MAG: hypothetical protein IT374_23430 [Polyangiaceae bacterium]|nr:hypothetical protein [Polyangiaceae bacterium]
MRVLLVAEPGRLDWFDYLAVDPELELELLWREGPDEPGAPPPFVRREHFLRDHRTARALLLAARPDRIVLMEIIALREVALIVAARALGIPTFYLEHGAAGDAATARARFAEFPVGERLRRSIARLAHLRRVAEVRYFYLSGAGDVSGRSLPSFLALPALLAALAPTRALARLRFAERVPETCIVFNRANQEEFELLHGRGGYRAALTGVPFFDAYHRPDLATDPSLVAYLDHPYLESGLLGWTEAHHRHVARSLARFAEARRLRVLVKLHPRSSLERWLGYELPPSVEIVQRGDTTEQLLRAGLVLTYGSSLATGLLSARRNLVALRWHPTPRPFGVDFAETGLCHRSDSVDELSTRFDGWLAENLAASRDAEHRAFLARFNEPFDGQARARVRALIKAGPGPTTR